MMSIFNNRPIDGSEQKIAEDAAQNLVHALLQLDKVNQKKDLIEIPKVIEEEFAKVVIRLLRKAGYKFAKVEQFRPENRLNYSVEKTIHQFGVRYRYSLGIGVVSVERAYAKRSNGLSPDSKLQVTGSRSPVILNDQLFLLQSAQPLLVTGIHFTDAVDTKSDSTQAKAATNPVLATPYRSPVITRELLDEPEFQNVHQLEHSNFKLALDESTLVREAVVIFSDDSMRLGRVGKAMLKNLVSNFDVTKEVVHLMGCSHGHSQLLNGNEELAKGRVIRTAQELYVLGVAPRKVLAEGCWSITDNDHNGHPRRGVTARVYRSDEAG